MTYIYLDESGDLGFTFNSQADNSSKHLVLAFWASSEKLKEIPRIVIDVKRKYRIPANVEIKASFSNIKIKTELLQKISLLPIEIYSVACYKPNVGIPLRNNPNIFYNYTAGLIMIPYILSNSGPFFITWDKRTMRVKCGFNFSDYIKYKIFFEHRIDTSMSFCPVESHLHKGIQVADFIVNAIYQKYEKKDTTCYSIIAPKIKEEKLLFF